MRLELTRRGDYAVRAMLSLAEHGGNGWLSVARISAAMDIPERFLPRVMAELARSGLVEGHLGRTGGYRLARPAASITLLDVIGPSSTTTGSGPACCAAVPAAAMARALSMACSPTPATRCSTPSRPPDSRT
jgi:Rrf2 family protein